MPAQTLNEIAMAAIRLSRAFPSLLALCAALAAQSARAEDLPGGAPIVPKASLTPPAAIPATVPASAPTLAAPKIAPVAAPAPVQSAPAPAATPAAAPVPAAPVATPATTAAAPAPKAPLTTGSLPDQPATPPQAAAPLPAAAAPAAAAKPAAKPKPRRAAWAPSPVILSQDPRPTLTPQTYDLSLAAAGRYQGIVAAGGWPRLPKVTLKPGMSGRDVAILKQRLAVEGDLAPQDAQGEAYDAATKAAVARFQARYSLPPSGVVTPATVAAMDVPADIRLQQITATVQRLAASQFPFGERYVVVNIPSAAVEAVENGKVFRRYTAIAGDPEHHSPAVETRVTAINFNPTWTVPTSIIKNEIIPHMRKNKGYLAHAGLKLYDHAGKEVSPAAVDWNTNAALAYTVRQPEGARNALGQIRIDMPNTMAVYMHDTPGKGAFGRADRFLSHGCVRVSDVRQLATWLLEGSNPGWTRQKTDEAIAVGARETVRLDKPVPVVWVYLTAVPQPDGSVQFHDDIYHLDTTGRSPGQPPMASAAASPTGGLW